MRPAAQDVIGGQVPCGLLAGPTVLPHVRSGRLVALAVSGNARSPTLPEVPTIAEAGVAGYQADFSLVMFAPSGTPEPIVTRLRAEAKNVVAAGTFQQSMVKLSQDVHYQDQPDFRKFIEVDAKRVIGAVRLIGKV